MYIVHLCKIYNFFRVVAFWSLQNGEGEGGEVESLGQVLIIFRLSMIFKMWASCSFSVIARGTTELLWIRALKWCVCVWGGGQKPQKYNIKTSLLLPIPYFETINRKGAVLKKKSPETRSFSVKCGCVAQYSISNCQIIAETEKVARQKISTSIGFWRQKYLDQSGGFSLAKHNISPCQPPAGQSRFQRFQTIWLFEGSYYFQPEHLHIINGRWCGGDANCVLVSLCDMNWGFGADRQLLRCCTALINGIASCPIPPHHHLYFPPSVAISNLSFQPPLCPRLKCCPTQSQLMSDPRGFGLSKLLTTL